MDNSNLLDAQKGTEHAHKTHTSHKKSSFMSQLSDSAKKILPSSNKRPMTNAAVFVGLFGVIGAVSLLVSFAATPANIALNKAVTVSSTESTATAVKPANMNDGSATTRWASTSGVDPQWAIVDLGSTFAVNRVVLNWEVAAAKNYDIQTSASATGPWTTIKSITGNATAGIKDYTSLTGTGRYVRVNMTARVTQWGYSLYEFEVYGTTPTTTPPPTTGTPVRYEAEKAVYGGCSEIKTVSSTAASGGTSVGWFGQSGCKLTFTVNASTAGNFAARIRYAGQPRAAGSSTTTPRTQTVNNAVTTIQMTPSSTDLNTWYTIYTTKELGAVALNAGSNTISYAIDNSVVGVYWDFDYLEVDSTTTTTTTCPTGTTGTYPNCVTNPNCPTGTTGTYPNCVSTACPAGQTGTPPNCVTPSNNPSGQAMPVGDITGWKQVFKDDFTTDVALGGFGVSDYHKGVNSSAYSSRWTGYPNTWHDTSGNGVYDQGKTVTVAGGLLNMFIHTENGIHEVAAPVPFIPGADANNAMTSGRYVVRFRSDSIPGYKTAWLLWPSSDVWPRDGEIDFPEGNLDGTISGFMHNMNGTSGGDQVYASSNGVTYSSWHTAVIEWRGGSSLKFILDGTNIGNWTSRVPSTPMQWILQTETNLDGYAPSNTAQGNLQIDWVTVYAAN